MHRFGNFPFRLDGNIPFSGGKRDSYIFQRTLDPATLAIAHPADFGKEYAAAFIELEAPRVTKGIVDALLLESRKIRALRKKIWVMTS